MTENEGHTFKIASERVDQWFEDHLYEPFTLDSICKDIGASEPEARRQVAKKLSYEILTKKRVEKNEFKHPSIYRFLNREKKVINWVDASEKDSVPFNWPKGRDGTSFPFDGQLTVRPTDIIVLAGTSNAGKSALCKNLVVENMDDWNGRLTYMVNEYQPARFKRSMNLMDWNTPHNSDGTLKFELIQRDCDWEYAIEPDKLNVIDWISMGGDFYKIGTVIKGIQERLHDGVAVVVIQKGEGNSLGTGGQFSEHFASYYLSVDFERITFKKAKEYHGYNPNGKSYGFKLADGVLLNELREVWKCNQCGGQGERFQKGVGKVRCIGCDGLGWM